MDDIRERQENEIYVIKSIYLDDCIELKDEPKKHAIDSKKKQSPVAAETGTNAPLLRITLNPQNSQSQSNFDQEAHVKVILKIKLTPNYPNEYFRRRFCLEIFWFNKID